MGRDGTDAPPRGSLLSRAVEEALVRYIKGGSYTWVAAQAAGISRRTFSRYMDRGEKDDEAGNARSRFRRFWMRVKEAQALARASAEVRVSRDMPLAWLRYGPGRDRSAEGEPGWTDSGDKSDQPPAGAYVIVFQNGAPRALLESEAAALSPAIDTTLVPDKSLPPAPGE